MPSPSKKTPPKKAPRAKTQRRAERAGAKSAAPGKKATAAAAVGRIGKKGSKRAADKASAAAGPQPRRAIFIDVENTSNQESLSKVIDSLKIEHAAQRTELYAFGNWRAVGQTMSRHLARLGATLVHTSPVTGVKDWSDLWIAVAAGRWIALASPGDVLEIVSNDKAFEAVGDAAANSGVIFRRVLHRATAAASSDEEAKPKRRRRRGGRGRRGGARRSESPAAGEKTPQAARPSRAASRPATKSEPAHRREPAAGEALHAVDGHGASHDQILAVIRRLTGGDPARWVNLDVIANGLKAEGFTRPPGSPRLVVRLRRMKDVEVQPNGMVRLVG